MSTHPARHDLTIGHRAIGAAHPPYIIAEIGVNHDGDPRCAVQLVESAAAAGADAVKFQLFEGSRLMSRAARLASYQKAAGERDPIEMLRRLELSIEQLAPCVDQAHRAGIHAIVSVFSVELVPLAATLAWDAYKSASPDIINRPLLEAMARTGRPLIVSTGAATIDEVARAVEWLTPWRSQTALLQCVSSYPTPIDAAELGGIAALAERFPGPVGYSDHTESVETGALAVRAGAVILEKHFTHDRSHPGPDHAASLDAAGFARYVVLAKAASHSERPTTPPPAAVKRVTPIEEDVRRVSRQSLTTVRPLSAGHTLGPADLTIKRPGTGLPPYELRSILGRTLARPVEADTPLMPEDLTA